MKRSLGVFVALFFVSAAVFARTTSCDLTGAQQEKVRAATADPVKTFHRAHPGQRVPALVQCESQMWRSIQSEAAQLKSDASPLRRAPRADRDRKQRAESMVRRGEDNGNGNAFGKSKDHGKPTEITGKKGGSSKADLRTLPQTPPDQIERPELEEPEPNPVMAQPDDSDAARKLGTESVRPPLVPAITAQAPATIMNFDGLDFQNWGAGHPPDTNGDVGPNYYIQTINTSIGIFRKSDGVRVAAFTFNTFAQNRFGNLCDTNNFGDPVVLYDSFEDRWVITDFAFALSGGNPVAPAFQCVAVSMTGDPVSGGWNYYSIQNNDLFGDYPKFGVWTDGIYMSANMFGFGGGTFSNSRVFAFNKAQMYAGAPTVQVVSFDAPSGDFTLLPSNARLQTGTPPAGTPNYFLSTWEFLNGLTIYKFHVDWDHVSLSSFTGPDVPIASTSWPNATVPNAPSLGGNALDVLQIRAMMQNQYTNLGGAESLWATHTVRRANTTGFAAPRWYQVNVTGGAVAAAIPQAATWDPDNANVIYRFMPSIAVDRAGNMALGYSTSSSTTKPAIKYAGRLATDPINTMSQTEQVLFQGSGTQVGNCGTSACIRWGDYSAMSLDPDGCTFWYTNEYYSVDGLNHQTRIGSFKFGPCTPVGSGGSLSGTVTAALDGSPIAGAVVAFGSRVATTNASGGYGFFNVPAGTYVGPVTVTFPGLNAGSASSIIINDGGTTTLNFTLSAAVSSACLTDTTTLDFQRGSLTNVDVTTVPDTVTLLNAPRIDQQNTSLGTSGFNVTTTQWIGQTFIPSVTAVVPRIDVNLFCGTCSGANPPVTLDIRATSGGLPTSTIIASTTIPGFSSGAGGYFTATFSPAPVLTAGTTYAIMTRLTTARAAGNYDATFSTANPYSRGNLVFTTTAGASWGSVAGDDLGFKIFVQTGYPSSGSVISSLKDANPGPGAAPTWPSLAWNATTPASTSVKFQAAASNSPFGPFTFVGPDGTASSFFTTSGASLSQFNGFRYLRYAAFLATSDSTATPSLADVTICDVVTQPTTLADNSPSATYGGPVTLTATLKAFGVAVASKSVSFTIDGNPVGSAPTDATGTASLAINLAQSVNAGQHSIGSSFAGDSVNFFSSTGTGTLTVGKATASISVTPYSTTYDGNSHTATAVVTGVFNEALTGIDLSSTTHTNAGTFTDNWTFTNANYSDANGSVIDSIGKANASLTVTGYSVAYDGNPHTATGSAKGAKGESLSGLDLTATTHTDAGDYSDNWSFTDVTGNYNNTTGTVHDSIGQANSASFIVVNGYSGTYDGLPHGATGSVTGIHGEDLSGLLSLGASFTAVPGGVAHWTFAGNRDYAPANGDAPIVINPATLTVTANDAARIYSYANPTFTASYSGFVNGETLATSGVTGSPSFSTTATTLSGVGTYPITVAAGTLAAQNYAFTFKSGTLTVYAAGFVGLDRASFGSNKAVADSFNSTGGYPSTAGSNALIVSNGTVEILGARINGNVTSSQSNVLLQPNSYVTGTVSAGTTITNTKATVLGGSTPNQLLPAIVAPAVTACGAFTLNPALSGGQYTYTNGDLTISGNALVTLANGTYCFHNVTISGQARLQVSGPVSINASGIVSVSGGGIVNTTHVPANLQIASSFSGAAGVAIAGGPDTYLTVYAPSTDVTVSGNASFFGAILGKTLTFSGNPDAHLDTAVGNIWSSFFGF